MPVKAAYKETGLGNELLGFVRSLLLSGVRHVVCTLERINDMVAREFAEELYRYVYTASDSDIVAAVWRAQRALVQKHPKHPHLWGPFIIVG